MSRPALPRIDVLASASQYRSSMSPAGAAQRGLEPQRSFDEASIKYLYQHPKDSPAQTPTAPPRQDAFQPPAPASPWAVATAPEPARNDSHGSSAYDQPNHLKTEGPTERRRRRMRKRFWALLVVGVAMLAAIAALAGLYIDLSRSYNRLLNNLASQPPPTNTASPGPATATTASILPTATSAGALTACPAADGQALGVAGTSKLFRRRCDSDFPGGEDGGLGPQGGAFGTVLDCVDACAAKVSEMACVGVVFTSAKQCILKSSFGLRRNATGYESALLVQ